MRNFQAGALDRKITIERNTPTRSASGAEVESWSEFANVWARVEYRSGREFQAAKQTIAEADVVFLVRAPLAATQKMRVKLNDRVFDILSVDDLSDRRLVRLTAKEGIRQGSQSAPLVGD